MTQRTQLALAVRLGGALRTLRVAAHLTVGRHKKCDVRLDDEKASARHCVFLRSGGELQVQDLDSRNGTFVNGVKVGTLILAQDDTVSVGNTHFKVVVVALHEDAQVGRPSALLPAGLNPMKASIDALRAVSPDISLLEQGARVELNRPREVTTGEQFERVEAMRVRHAGLVELKSFRDKVIRLRERKTIQLAMVRYAGRIYDAEETALFLGGGPTWLVLVAQGQRVSSPGDVPVNEALVQAAATGRCEVVEQGRLAMPVMNGDTLVGVLYCASKTEKEAAVHAELIRLLREVVRTGLAVLAEC